jgi:hypothetical protein
MDFEIRDDINPALQGVSWLLGTWLGNGHGNWPPGGEFEFGQQVEFATNGGPYLHYLSQTWTLDADGQPLAPLTMETGFWRPQPDAAIEVIATHPEGVMQLWMGRIQGKKIELTTDFVARTNTASAEDTGGQRLYGHVEGDLLYAWDRATLEVPMQPYMWARLKRAGEPG